MKINYQKLGKFVFKLLVSLIFVVWLVFKTDWNQVVFYLQKISLFQIFLYVAVLLVGISISAYKWKLLAEAKDFRLPLVKAFRLYLTGNFINNFMPSVIGGDTFRAFQIGKAEKKYSLAVASVLMDRITGLLGAMVLSVFFGLWNWRITSENHVLMMLFWIVLFCLIFVSLLRFLRKFPFWKKVSVHLPKKLIEFIRDFVSYQGSGIIGKSMVVSMLFGLVGLAALNWILFWGLGIKIGLLNYLSVIFLISIVSSLPVSINNIGIKEWAYVTFFGIFGVSSGAVVAVALVSRILQMIVSFSALPTYLKSKKKEDIEKKKHENEKKHKKSTPNKILLIAFALTLIGGGCFWYLFANKKLSFQQPVPSQKIETIKIGIINDLHAIAVQKGRDPLRLALTYQRRMQSFVQQMDLFAPEIIVANGDMVEGTRQTPELAMRELTFVKDFFEQNFSVPTFWTIGNHELRAVNRQQWKSSLRIDYEDLAIEKGGYKMIFLDGGYGTGGIGNDIDDAGSNILLSDDQLKWLEKELANSNKIKLVFMHFPPIYGPDVKASYVPVGAENLQKLFSRYKVAAVFSGHVERTVHKNIDGVDYYVLPGISKNQEYDDVFARIRMIDGKAIVTLFYKDGNLQDVSKRIE